MYIQGIQQEARSLIATHQTYKKHNGLARYVFRKEGGRKVPW